MARSVLHINSTRDRERERGRRRRHSSHNEDKFKGSLSEGMKVHHSSSESEVSALLFYTIGTHETLLFSILQNSSLTMKLFAFPGGKRGNRIRGR